MNKNNLKILFISSEVAPIAKVGGLGDVIGSLPKELKKLGCDVRIAIPKYGFIDEKKYSLELIAQGIGVNGKEQVAVYKGFLPESEVPVYFLENEKFFSEGDVYFEKTAFVGSVGEIRRFLFFSQAVLKIFSEINWLPDIIHCHDWHTAILPVLAKSQFKTILTIHNLANQGFDILQQGIMAADLLNTVSPTYGKEILTVDYGCGLEKFLLKRKKDLYGILNGIDEKRFNPETDCDIKENYSWKNIGNKIKNKTALQKELGFIESPEIPLVGMINRLTDQKGIDLVIDIIPQAIAFGCQIVFLGVGADNYENKLLEFSRKYPDNISANIKFDAVLAQKIYAGADIFLMPSRFEPCGLGQLISQRYGTVPIVRQTGGLADTVKDKKTGFVFKEYSSEALLKCLEKALAFYKNQEKWQKMQKKAMSKDFSWSKSAKEYLKLYKKLV